MKKFFKLIAVTVIAFLASFGSLWLLGMDENCGESLHGFAPDACYPFGEWGTLSILDFGLAFLAGMIIGVFLWDRITRNDI